MILPTVISTNDVSKKLYNQQFGGGENFKMKPFLI